ncbi:MAG: hypothetical protein Fur0037_28230 [Planctomycetota bacterium]
MILNQTAEYALRAAAILASASPGESLRASTVSERTGIPQHYLSKILRRLVVAGLIRSQRGQGGGFTLAEDPSRITILDVLEATDYRLDPDRCPFGMERCDDDRPCPMHPVWAPLKKALQAWAAGHTLADMRRDSAGTRVRVLAGPRRGARAERSGRGAGARRH